jgi:hypothetical protein
MAIPCGGYIFHREEEDGMFICVLEEALALSPIMASMHHASAGPASSLPFLGGKISIT